MLYDTSASHIIGVWMRSWADIVQRGRVTGRLMLELQLFVRAVYLHGAIRASVGLAVGVAIILRHRCFLVDHLPRDGHDIILDELLTHVLKV